MTSRFLGPNLLVRIAFLAGVFMLGLSPAVFGQNDLQQIGEGGHLFKLLISNPFPSEIDAGMWENFNRFNIETLPQKDWLRPFGKPSAGSQKSVLISLDEKSETRNQKLDGTPLPEVGAASTSRTFADATEISWVEFNENDPIIDFFRFHENKPIGTAYAAAYLMSSARETRFIETDGFLGAIWLNGEKIYDGYSLSVKKVVAAQFRAGENLLVVRSSGVSGDYWRKDGGWTALIRFWKDRLAAENSAEYKSTNTAGSIFYLEGFHVDPVYLQDQRGYSKVTLANTNQYVSSLRADPSYGVYLSEIDYLKPYLDTHPEDRGFLRGAVRQGRVGTGGAYNQFNENTIGGEAIIRNILYGQEMHKSMLGRKSESLALWDVFGHSPQISQIAAKSGFSGITWSKKITGFQPFFYDYALDGSRLLHRRVDYAYSFSGFGSGKNYSLDNFRRMTEGKFKETRSFGSSVDLRINAADFTPPWTNLAGNAGKLEKNTPRIRVTGQAQDLYFRELAKEIASGKVKAPITSRDKLFFHVGVSMARSDLKIGQRLAENATLTAEKFGSIAYLLGAASPDLALDKAWRQIFFGSHHDAITGTPSDSAFLDLVLGYREAFELSNEALRDSLGFIAKQIKTGQAVNNTRSRSSIIVFNPMNWSRNDLVRVKVADSNLIIRDSLGKPVPHSVLSGNEIEFIARDVPSIGYKTYYAEPASIPGVATRAGYPDHFENEFYRIEIDAARGGAIKSIYDKQAKREVITNANGRLGNEIAVLEEDLTKKNVTYPAWEMWTTGKKAFSGEVKASIAFERDGENQTLTIRGVLPNKTSYLQTITLRDGIKRIDFKTDFLDYTGYNELFTVNFPLNLSGGALVTEDRFGTVVRNGSKGFLDFKTNTDKLISGAPVYSVNNWAEYGSVLNLKFRADSPSAGTVASVPFKPTALIRPHGNPFESATKTLVSSLIKRGVSVTPFYDDNESARRRDLTIEDSTMPKKLNDDIAYQGFRIAVGGENENAYTEELLRLVSPETKMKFEMRLQRDSFAFLFLYDKNVPQGWDPLPVLVIAGDVVKASENLTLPIRKGSSMRQPSRKGDNTPEIGDTFSIQLPMDCFATETNPRTELPMVPDYGVALINNGTAGVSLENPNTLTLHLTHTAPFPGVNLPFEFVPENKSHVYTYSLYPHEKDWREANTVRAGYDFNNSLIAIQTDLHTGNLPTEKSFFSTGDSSLVVSALKLGGNPLATFKSGTNGGIGSNTKNGLASKLRPIVLREYESSGIAAAPAIETSFPITRGQELGIVEQSEFKPSGPVFTGSKISDKAGFGAFEIRTFELFCVRRPSESQTLGSTKEPVQPVFSRYWQHNMGAAPIGNDAVKVSLRPVEQMGNLSSFSWADPYNQGGITTVSVRVQVVNNYQDRQVSGEVTLEVADGWRIVPDKLAYEIEPNGAFVKDVVVIAYPVKKDLDFDRASGLVKARIEHDGQTFQDVLQFGKPFKLEWRTEQTDSGVAVYVKNPYRQSIEGAVALITPPETWALGAYSTEPLFSREQGFSAPANSEVVLRFDHGALLAGTWKIARLVYNGNIEYKRADGKLK